MRHLWALMAVAAAVVMSGACEDEGATMLGPSSPCDGLYQGLCGTACSTDDECPIGLYCGETGTCTAQCTPIGIECASGLCDPRGRCRAGAGGAGGLQLEGGYGGSAASGGQGGACGSVDVTFEGVIPTVVLLIDQSGSMDESFGGERRWDVVYDVLMDPADGVLQALQGSVRFGLVLYTYDGQSQQCPQLVSVLPPALNNRDAIDDVYGPAGPESNTPTGESLAAITPDLAAFAEPGPKLIILATDGDPDRCDDPNGHDAISKGLSVDAVEAAYAQGIETVIIAVGDQVSDAHQQDMANAGQGLPVPAANPCNDPNACAPTYEPATKQAMIDAFNAIIGGQRSCVFQLDGEVVAGRECEGVVTVNDEVLPCNDPNGWQLNGTSEIEFLGSACETILGDPSVTISATFPCDVVVPA